MARNIRAGAGRRNGSVKSRKFESLAVVLPLLGVLSLSARSARSAERDLTFFESLGVGLPINDAARNAGYQRSRVYQWRKDDAAFASE